MTSEQLLTITKMLNQVDPVSIREDEGGTTRWILDLGASKEIEIYASGAQFWCQNGKQHREDGPAVIYADGAQRWYQNDKRHRAAGPAVINANGTQFWWLNGEPLSEAEYARRTNKTT